MLMIEYLQLIDVKIVSKLVLNYKLNKKNKLINLKVQQSLFLKIKIIKCFIFYLLVSIYILLKFEFFFPIVMGYM